jgi:hypothetical protein
MGLWEPFHLKRSLVIVLLAAQDNLQWSYCQVSKRSTIWGLTFAKHAKVAILSDSLFLTR